MPEFDTTKPNVARMYDYYLGGKNHFGADREAAEKVLAALPEARDAAVENRRFVQRAVRHLESAGIDQFIDIGAGLPTQENVHEIASHARVAYVDNDPVVFTHGNALLAGARDGVKVLAGDLRRPAELFADPELRALIDLDRPVAVLLAAILHFVGDEERPHEMLDRIRAELPPGSYLVISHASGDADEEARDRVTDAYRSASSPYTSRSRTQISRFFGDFELLDPGLVHAAEWHGEPTRRSFFYVGVGVKPER